MGSYERVRFKHVIIDAAGPMDPHIKAVGDVNGDGIAEVIIPSSRGGPLVWYAYPGWTKHVIAPAGTWSCDAKVVDMDGDGDGDLLISDWRTHNRIEWYENPLPRGDPATDPWRQHILGSPRAHDLAVGDIDGDGQMEIVGRWKAEEGNRIYIWRRDGAGTWAKRAIECPAGEGLALGDIDMDGKLEVIIGGRWYKASGDILHDPWQERVFADWPADAVVRVADLNKDGRPDVVLTKTEGLYRLSWFEVPADPAGRPWPEHIIDPAIHSAHALAVCDMDQDGNLDVITAEQHRSPGRRVMVYFHPGDGAAWRRQVVATGGGSHNICVADLDGDGKPDIVGANWTGEYQPIELWQNLGRA